MTAPLLEPGMSPYEAALVMAPHDWYVIPLDHPDLPQCAGPKTDSHDPATCDKRGKHPAIKWDSGASTSVENITYWFSGNPRNVGIHCGKSGLLVIDEDAPGELARFAADHGVEVPDTFTVKTANGQHYYFTDTEAGALGNREGAFGAYKINIRSGNGYVVAHGSKHESGITYTANGTRTVAPLPGWVPGAIRGKQPSGSDHDESRARFELPDVIKDGHRDEVLYPYACSLRSYDLPFNTALVLMKDAWNRCEQPPVAKTMYEWATAVSKLKAAYRRYDGGRSEEYQKPSEAARRIRLTPLSTIKPRPVRWLWADPEGRIPIGEVTLTPGRGGLGKSTFHAWVIAKLTRGTLPGVHFGTPKPCIVAASEDSYARTVVPRLMAAGADMDLVYRVDVVTETDDEMTISLPDDIEALIVEIRRIGAAVVSLDPVMSLIFSKLDSHKDREMRLALEPLASMADRTDCAVLGNAHFNKSAGSDPLTMIMASSAFGNVARAAIGFARDADGSCIISQIKNNLGRMDLPSFKYRIDSTTVETVEGPADVGRFVIDGESKRSVYDILRDRGTDKDGTGKHSEIDEWLISYLTDSDDHQARAAEVIAAGENAGYSEDAIKRARKRIKAEWQRHGFGKDSYITWTLIDAVDAEDSGEPRIRTYDTYGDSEEPQTRIDAIEDTDVALQASDTNAHLYEAETTCQALTWRVCKNPKCRTLGGCILADADTTTEEEDDQ